MKNLLKLGMALLIAAMLFGFAGCFEPPEDDPEGDNPSGVNYGNFTGANRAMAFKNPTDYKLVLFAKEVSASTIIGGINPNTPESGVSKANTSGIWNASAAFPVIALTEAQYTKNKDKLSVFNTASTSTDSSLYPFARIYVFYNKDQDTSIPQKVYEISNKLGGSNMYLEISMPNNTTWNAELRDGGIMGSAIGYAPYGIMNTRIYISPDTDFNVFPVFHRWNAIREILDVAYPMTSDGSGHVRVPVQLNSDEPNFRINMRDILESVKNQKPQLGAAYVNVYNSIGAAIQMTRNGQPIRNALGSAFFGSSGAVKTFTIDMTETLPGSGVYSDSVPWSGIKIGMDGDEQNLVISGDSSVTNSNLSLNNGMIYTIRVTGTYMAPTQVVPTIYLNTSGTDAIQEFVFNDTVQAQ